MPLSDTLLPRSDKGLTDIGFLLIPGFALLSYACAIEPLRAANILSGRTLYRWRHFSPDGKPAAASNGVAVTPEQPMREAPDPDCLLVCAGGNPAAFRHPATLAWLRRLARRGVRLGGVSGGAYVLARAGVLGGYRFTLHWEHAPALREEFPDLRLRRCLFEIDRDRLTCAGGSAALDMMHALLIEAHGPALALAVSEWFLQTQIRQGAAPQRMDPQERLGVRSPALLRALALMERKIETPCSREELAAAAGLSARQLERLFQAQLGCSPGAHYLRLRLERGRALVRQTGLSVAEAAMACGFASPSHFSRAYRAAFGLPPAADRRRLKG